MKKLLNTIVFLFVIGLTSASAQKYKSAAGVRMDGQMFGVTYSQRVFNALTAEGNLDFRNQEVKISAVGKYHKPILGKSLTMFIGGGYHLGSLKDYGSFSGLDLTVGVEHKILLIPFSVGFEINPSIHIMGSHPNWYTFQSVFSIKYVIIKDKEGYFSKSQQRQREKARRKRLRGRIQSKYERQEEL
jgi:hypothetical protein